MGKNTKLAFTRDQNQIATPWHIVEFLSELFDVKGKKLFDPTAGNGAMFAFADKQCGIELDQKPYEELCEKYPDGIFINSSLFDSEEWIKEQKPDLVFMNPPFNVEPTKGLEFVRFTTDVVNRGYLAAIVPDSVVSDSKKAFLEAKKSLLERHTLKAVLKLNKELFYPAANASVVILILKLGIPHNEDTWFANFEEDGLVKNRTQGRIDSDNKWLDIKKTWLELYKEKPSYMNNNPEGKPPCILKKVTEKDSWLPSAHIERDPSELVPTYEDFYKTVYDYMKFKIEREGLQAYLHQNPHLLPSKEERKAMINNQIQRLQKELEDLDG